MILYSLKTLFRSRRKVCSDKGHLYHQSVRNAKGKELERIKYKLNYEVFPWSQE